MRLGGGDQELDILLFLSALAGISCFCFDFQEEDDLLARLAEYYTNRFQFYCIRIQGCEWGQIKCTCTGCSLAPAL